MCERVAKCVYVDVYMCTHVCTCMSYGNVFVCLPCVRMSVCEHVHVCIHVY